MLLLLLFGVVATAATPGNLSANSTSSTVYVIRHGEKKWSLGCLNDAGCPLLTPTVPTLVALPSLRPRHSAASMPVDERPVTHYALSGLNIEPTPAPLLRLAAIVAVPHMSLPDWCIAKSTGLRAGCLQGSSSSRLDCSVRRCCDRQGSPLTRPQPQRQALSHRVSE